MNEGMIPIHTGLPVRQIAFGTRHRVMVVYVAPRILVCVDWDTQEREGYVLVDVDTTGVVQNDEGFLTFEPGGPMGGHWAYRPRTDLPTTPDASTVQA